MDFQPELNDQKREPLSRVWDGRYGSNVSPSREFVSGFRFYRGYVGFAVITVFPLG